ncbi:MAG TPA: XdhC family protein [Candidatus Krumholzibacteria bacterium]|nr:XdhC family protein [Candidatus Krumholzibacteria bacterium]HPD73187.1 XdhC family protein [Candidatus Krumholzibacteria bacterium]HRY41935.1 XdhC family protein [Candidatus Krumholzibacteria bacterium]
MQDIYTEIISLRARGQAAVLVTVVASEGHVPTELQAKMLVDARGRVAGTVGGGKLEHRAIAEAQGVLAAGRPLLKEYALEEGDGGGRGEPLGMICGGRVTLFYEVLGPGTRAYLFGAGHVGRALRDYLAPLDFAVTFIDSRPDQLADLAGPRALAGPDYAELPPLADLAVSYVVIATHSHTCDERVLEHVLRANERPRYLGVVASRRKRVEMLARVREQLGGDIDLDWIHMPVGLYLGGNSPAAVALSIAAEMQACRHGVSGHVHLRDRARPGRPREG